MNPFRRILRHTLAILARWAIHKHKMELVVITGWYGTSMAREMLYTILNDKLKVRRNTVDIWWDFSIPLAILGYKDMRRSTLKWAALLACAFIYLLFAKPNPHILILDADCTYPQTATYWASFVKPDQLLILNYEKEARIVSELIQTTIDNDGVIVYNPDQVPAVVNKKLKRAKTLTYGNSEKANLSVTAAKSRISISFNKKYVRIPQDTLPKFAKDILGGVFAVAAVKGIDLAEAAFSILKFELPKSILAKIRTNLAF